jgi:hypothetical protein
MRYWYYDLDQQPDDRLAVLRMRGSGANVILLDPLNFDRYRHGQSFFYLGGYRRGTPVRVEIPKDEYWYLVIDDGGGGGRVHPELDVQTPNESDVTSEHEATALGSRT